MSTSTHSEGNAPIRVLCVDDNEFVADALRLRIEQESSLAWVGGARGNEGDLPQRVKLAKADVVLMDVDIPGVDTFALLEQVGATCQGVRVVMLSGHVHQQYVDRALDGGAWGYLSKNEEGRALMEAIRAVHRGQIVLSEEVHMVQQRSVATGKAYNDDIGHQA